MELEFWILCTNSISDVVNKQRALYLYFRGLIKVLTLKIGPDIMVVYTSLQQRVQKLLYLIVAILTL